MQDLDNENFKGDYTDARDDETTKRSDVSNNKQKDCSIIMSTEEVADTTQIT